MSVISYLKRKALGHVFRGADAPDNSGANAAALENARLSKESLEFYKSEMARTQDTRDEATQIANETARLQLGAAKTGLDQAQEAYQYQTGTFRPVEQQLVTMAQNFDTPERREAEAAQAVADVNMSASTNRTATMRELARRNGSISGGRALALMDSQDIGAAKAAGSAANTARRSVEQQGWAPACPTSRTWAATSLRGRPPRSPSPISPVPARCRPLEQRSTDRCPARR